MQPPDKFHVARLKSIAKSLAADETNKKALVAMAVKMERSLSKLKENIAKLDSKINRYKTLQTNVQNDPNYNAKTDLNSNFYD